MCVPHPKVGKHKPKVRLEMDPWGRGGNTGQWVLSGCDGALISEWDVCGVSSFLLQHELYILELCMPAQSSLLEITIYHRSVSPVCFVGKCRHRHFSSE